MCAICGHAAAEHMRHENAVMGIADKRELCLECPGYEAGLDERRPRAKAWHRFKEVKDNA